MTESAPTPSAKQPTVSMISLGCPRTLVDSEVYLGRLAQSGFRIVDQTEGSDVVVINTCAFVQDAIKESIDTVMDAVELKRRGKIKSVLVAGCLVQRFKDELIKELPEVDGFIGVDGFTDIDRVADQALGGRRSTSVRKRPSSMYQGHPERVALTPSHYGYLKISEGCLKGCSFCVIPKIKGPLASRPMEELVEEARQMAAGSVARGTPSPVGIVPARSASRGVKELVVVGQDTSDYGVDRYGAPRIAELLRALGQVDGLEWIRLLYCHPRGITPSLIRAIAETPRVCKYLDMAIEHADDDMLARMNRGTSRGHLLNVIRQLREAVPGIALRTSVIVGFPGETERAFEQLLSFLQEARFDRLGAFMYSNEEGSAAYRLAEQIPDAVKQERYDRLMALQQQLAGDLNAEWLGRTVRVLVDERDASDRAGGEGASGAAERPTDTYIYLARSAADAPEVDGLVYVTSPAPLPIGSFATVRITDTYEYDLTADVVDPQPTT